MALYRHRDAKKTPRVFFAWLILLLVCVPAVALANPAPGFEGIRPPLKAVAFVMVALLGEAILISAVLLFFRLGSLQLTTMLYLGGLAIYGLVFLPVFWVGGSVLLAEAIIVAVDGAFIKLLSCCYTFQMEGFKRLKWYHALLASLVGNGASYLIGLMAWTRP